MSDISKEPSGSKTKSAGRPPADDGKEVRDRLLHTAERVISEKGFASTSIRELARQADVTPAMIHYYFGSKRGLYEALLSSVIGRVLQNVKVTLEDGLETQDRVKSLVGVFAETILNEPWLPAIVIREVLLNESNMRSIFVEQYASQLAVLIPSVISHEVSQDNFRSDLNPQLAFMSLLGMTAFPFMARPIFEEVFKMEYNDDFKKQFTEHTSKLFFDGVNAKGKDREI